MNDTTKTGADAETRRRAQAVVRRSRGRPEYAPTARRPSGRRLLRAADRPVPAPQRLQPARGPRRRAGRDAPPTTRPSRPASGRCSTTSCGLREVRVDDVMVPRADIEAVEIDTSLGDLLSLFEQSGHSRMPVYPETLDDPRGMVHINDVIGHITRARPRQARAARTRKPPAAPRSTSPRSTSPSRSASSTSSAACCSCRPRCRPPT